MTLKVEWTCEKEYRPLYWSREQTLAGSQQGNGDLRPTAAKRDSANNLNELGSGFSSQVSRLQSSLIRFLILAL